MGTVLFIEDAYHTERHVTRGFRLGAVRNGWTPKVTWLRDAAGSMRDPEDLAGDIEESQPDLIVWTMDWVLPSAQALLDERFRSIPKASLWFDDFKRTYAIHHHTSEHRRLCNDHHTLTYVWDGFWRAQFQSVLQIPSHPIHLAADEIDFFPQEASHFKGFENAVIFIGNIPSLSSIEHETSALPVFCRILIERTAQLIQTGPYARLPYDALQEAYEGLDTKLRLAVDHFREDIAHNVLLNRLAWLHGKREVRLRILRLAVRQADLAILSGHSEKTFAQADELSKELGNAAHRVHFVNTDHVALHQLGCLYHIGGLHLQATDPQSVAGGIPFRVFETAASGRPLLSDFKPELAATFEGGREILFYQNDGDFSEKLSLALQARSSWKEIGEAAQRRFLAEHTWKHRFQTIAQPVSAIKA